MQHSLMVAKMHAHVFVTFTSFLIIGYKMRNVLLHARSHSIIVITITRKEIVLGVRRTIAFWSREGISRYQDKTKKKRKKGKRKSKLDD